MNKTRRFIVDYRDRSGCYYNVEMKTNDTYDEKMFSNDYIINSIINDYKITNITVSSILEIFDGYTEESLKKLPVHEVSKHLKLLYINPEDKTDYLNTKGQFQHHIQSQ